MSKDIVDIMNKDVSIVTLWLRSINLCVSSTATSVFPLTMPDPMLLTLLTLAYINPARPLNVSN